MNRIYTLISVTFLFFITLGSMANPLADRGKDKSPLVVPANGNTQRVPLRTLCTDTSSSTLTIEVCADTFTLNGVTYKDDGIYTQKFFTNAAGCDSTVHLSLKLKAEKPVLTIDRLTLGTTNAYKTYQWHKNDLPIPGATSQTYTLVPPLPGYYHLVVNAPFCPDTTGYYIISEDAIYLSGALYKRNDANCTFNEGVDAYIEVPVKLRLDKNNIPQDTIVGTSTFSLIIRDPDTTAEYSLQLIQVPPGYIAVCPDAGQQRFRTDTLSETWTPQFGLDCSTSNTQPDLYTYMNTLLRVVDKSYLSIAAGNAACNSKDATIILELSPKYRFNEASRTPSVVNGQTISWNLKDLKGGYHEYISVVLDPVGNLTPGDSSCNTVSITPLAGDVDPVNNRYSSCSEIRASYDPNDKKVSPSGEITPGTELTYTINFENLGNDTAFDIHILDTLSNSLLYSSFELIFSSHLAKISFSDVVDPRVARFEFPNIRLADKNSPAYNKGTLIYKIKARGDLPPGATIENTAHIFFDINPAVVTNTTLNTIGEGSNIRTGITVAAPRLYPNPVGDQLYVDNPSAQLNRMMIINMLGQSVYQREIKEGINIISTATLAPGIYYIKLSGAYEAKPVKIIRK